MCLRPTVSEQTGRSARMSNTAELIDEEYKAANRFSDSLFRSYQDKFRARRRRSLVAGSMALIAGGGMAAALAPFLDSNYIRLGAALLAAVSGVLSLLNSTYSDEHDMREMLAGSNEYLSIRRRIDVFRSSDDKDDSRKQHRFYQFLTADMQAASEKYKKHIPPDMLRALRGLDGASQMISFIGP